MTFLNASTRPIFVTLLALLLSIPLPALSATERVLVSINGIDATAGGRLVVALFAAEGSWPKHETALLRTSVAVSSSQQQVEFTPVTPGTRYAVQVFHDANDNDRLDFRWFPYPRPREGVGVSNNNVRFGPPDFSRALFTAGSGTTAISIDLRY